MQIQRSLINITVNSIPILRRSYSLTPSVQIGLVKNVWNWMSQKYRKTPGYSAYHLFQVSKGQALNEEWQARSLLPSDFRSQQLLIVMHVWMIHKRLLQEERHGLLVQECMFDLLWDDTSMRLHKHGVGDFMLNKYLKQVQSMSFHFCVELDKALEHQLQLLEAEEPSTHTTAESESDKITFSNPEEGTIADIGGVLFRTLYSENDSISEDHIMELARYVRREQLALQQLSSEELFLGKIKWGPIPWENKSTSVKQSLNDAWEKVAGEDGKIYYWNRITKESTWEKPN